MPWARSASTRAGFQLSAVSLAVGGGGAAVRPKGSASSRASAAKTEPSRRRPSLCARPKAQAARPRPSPPTSASATPGQPLCAQSTETSQSAAPYMGQAMMRRSFSIQGPGRGSSRVRPGASARISVGAASPRPSAANTARVAGAGMTKAAPIAAAMKGAVQGLATNTASAPVAKLPKNPPRAAICPPAPIGPPRAKTPDRFSPTASISQAIASTKTGEVN